MIGPVERRLVVSFSELRPGLTVIGTGCLTCRRDHTAVITSRTAGRSDAWDWAPVAACGMEGVSARGVAQGRVFRLVDPALEPADQYQEDLEVVAVQAAERARRRAPALRGSR